MRDILKMMLASGTTTAAGWTGLLIFAADVPRDQIGAMAWISGALFLGSLFPLSAAVIAMAVVLAYPKGGRGNSTRHDAPTAATTAAPKQDGDG